MAPPIYIGPLTNGTIVGVNAIVFMFSFPTLPPNDVNQYPIFYFGDGGASTTTSGAHYELTYGDDGDGSYGFNVSGYGNSITSFTQIMTNPSPYSTFENTPNFYIGVLTFTDGYPHFEITEYGDGTRGPFTFNATGVAPSSITQMSFGASPTYTNVHGFTLLQCAYYTGNNYGNIPTGYDTLVGSTNLANIVPNAQSNPPYTPYTFGGAIGTGNNGAVYQGVLFHTTGGSPDTSVTGSGFFGNGIQFHSSSADQITLSQYLSLTPICFLEGALILTNSGLVKVEDLRAGMMVKTSAHGYKVVTMVGTNRMFNSGASTRGRNQLYLYPASGLIVTGGHSVLRDVVNGMELARIKQSFGGLFFTEGKIRLAAMDDDDAIPYLVGGNFNIYNFVLEASNENTNYGVYANGMLVESSFPYWVEKMEPITPPTFKVMVDCESCH